MKRVTPDPALGTPPAFPPVQQKNGYEPGEGRNGKMGWMMLFWVALIVAVPTLLWFLLAEKRGNHR